VLEKCGTKIYMEHEIREKARNSKSLWVYKIYGAIIRVALFRLKWVLVIWSSLVVQCNVIVIGNSFHVIVHCPLWSWDLNCFSPKRLNCSIFILSLGWVELKANLEYLSQTTGIRGAFCDSYLLLMEHSEGFKRCV